MEAEGHDVIRFFRPDAGLTISHFDALAAIDPYASEMLSTGCGGEALIDRGFDWLRFTGSHEVCGYAFWNQVPDHKSFELAAKEIEVTLYQQREELRKERDRHDESKINPLEDWSVIVVRQGTFPLHRWLVVGGFPRDLSTAFSGIVYQPRLLAANDGEDGDRFDRCLCQIGNLGDGRRTSPRKKGVLANHPLSTGKVHEEDTRNRSARKYGYD